MAGTLHGDMDPVPGEEVFFHGHPSWRSMLLFYTKGLAMVLVAGILAGIITDISSSSVNAVWVVLIVVVGFALVIAIGILRRLGTRYTITDRRLTIELGILNREMHETRLERVQNVGTGQSLAERLLRIGTVNFDTAAEEGFDFRFRGVENPLGVVRTVDRAIGEQQERMSQRPQTGV